MSRRNSQAAPRGMSPFHLVPRNHPHRLSRYQIPSGRRSTRPAWHSPTRGTSANPSLTRSPPALVSTVRRSVWHHGEASGWAWRMASGSRSPDGPGEKNPTLIVPPLLGRTEVPGRCHSNHWRRLGPRKPLKRQAIPKVPEWSQNHFETLGQSLSRIPTTLYTRKGRRHLKRCSKN